MHFTVNVDYTITFITQYTRQEVQNAERGMLREMDSLDVRDELDRITQDYCSFEPTQDFEPTQGNFNWPLIDAVVTKCAGRGKKTAFAIEPAKKGMQATPLWLFTQLGCGFETTTGAGPLIKVPVWSDPIYIDRMRELATQLAGRYDGHDNIAFIDGRSYGNWGEWHVHGLKGISAADKTTLASLVNVWNVFTQTTVIIKTTTIIIT